MAEFDSLDAAMADARAARAHHRDQQLSRRVAEADFHRRFREWAETTAGPALEAVADHVHDINQHSSVHVHHPDLGAGRRESVELNVDLMGKYTQLTFRALVPELAVGVSENHGTETTETLEALSGDEVLRRAINLVTQAIVKSGEVEDTA